MNIIAYVKTGCPWCMGLTELLKQKRNMFIIKYYLAVIFFTAGFFWLSSFLIYKYQ